MMMTEVSFNTTIWQIFSSHILNFLGHENYKISHENTGSCYDKNISRLVTLGKNVNSTYLYFI